MATRTITLNVLLDPAGDPIDSGTLTLVADVSTAAGLMRGSSIDIDLSTTTSKAVEDGTYRVYYTGNSGVKQYVGSIVVSSTSATQIDDLLETGS